jgi:hypothetical protein
MLRHLAERLFAWSLLLGLAVASFIAAMVLTESEVGNPLMLAHLDGPIENWTLCLLALSIGATIYVLSGVETGVWSLPLAGVAIVLSYASVLLVLGFYGLILLLASGVIAKVLVRSRRRRIPLT